MRAEERLDEKTRKKTRLRRDGIFGSGFVASRENALPDMLASSPLPEGVREEGIKDERRRRKETLQGRREEERAR